MSLAFHPARALLPGLFLLLAAGPCAASLFSTTADDPLKRAPGPGEGIVAVSVTTNIAEFLEITTFHVRRIGEPGQGKIRARDADTYLLEAVATPLAFDSTVFMGVLPAGDYEVLNVSMMPYVVKRSDPERGVYGDKTITRTIGEGNEPVFGIFTVLPGQTVDLGRTVITAVNKLYAFGRSALHTDNRILFGRKSAPHARLLERNPAPGWNGPRSAMDEAETMGLRRPVGAACFSEYADGRIAAAAKMGSVLLRSAAGAWTSVQGKGIDALACVLPVALPDATLIGVGEANTIVRLAPGANTLTPVDPGDLPNGNLIYVAGNEKAGWYLTLHNDKVLTVYHAHTIDGGRWKQVNSLPLNKDFWWGESGFWPWRTARGFGFAVGDSLHVLDYASGQWATRKTPGGMRIDAAQASADGAIGIRGKLLAGAYITRDEGLSWKEVSTPLNSGVPLQAPGGELWTSSRPLLSAPGSGPTLHASADQGGKWIKVGDYSGGHVEILPSGAMLSHGSERDIYAIRRSPDNGVSWITEYHNFLRKR